MTSLDDLKALLLDGFGDGFGAYQCILLWKKPEKKPVESLR